MGLFTQPALGLVDEAEFVIVDAHRADRTFTEIEDFMANGWALAGDRSHLVVAIQVVLVGPITDHFSLQQLSGDIRITGRCDEGGKPVHAREDAVLHRVRWHVTGPAKERGHTEAAFEHSSLGLRERGLSTIRPGED